MSRVLWLCKSRYMNHDVIDDRYARLFEIPHCLGAHAQVRGFCLDYRLARPKPVPADLAGEWHRANVPRTLFIGWFLQLLCFARAFRPQVVIASSDCFHVVLGALLARLLGARFYADLYDDYASFGLARIPGMRWLYHRALSRADGICAVSRTLGQDMEKAYPGTAVLVLESTIGGADFTPLDSSDSLHELGLGHLAANPRVGICGGLNRHHGADVTFASFDIIARQVPDVAFVVAGRLDDECPLPARPFVHYIGTLPHSQMARFYSAVDVVIVPLSNTRFGYYAFPQKAYEVLACGRPAVASDVGALAMLFQTLPAALYTPDSPQSLADAVAAQLRDPALLDVDIPTWSGQAAKLAAFIAANKDNSQDDSPVTGCTGARGTVAR